mgnify:CR=1 FL=1
MKKILFAISALFVLAACSHDNIEQVPMPGEGTTVVNFSVQLPEMQEATRSFIEHGITRLHLLVFDENGYFVKNSVSGRFLDETQEYPKAMFDYMDVSPKMVFSVATAMIPFLENDDANRALMGSNMQRQAVPLLVPEAPLVGTGLEFKAGQDSGVVILAREDGVVEKVAGDQIVIRDEHGERHVYKLIK